MFPFPEDFSLFHGLELGHMATVSSRDPGKQETGIMISLDETSYFSWELPPVFLLAHPLSREEKEEMDIGSPANIVYPNNYYHFWGGES